MEINAPLANESGIINNINGREGNENSGQNLLIWTGARSQNNMSKRKGRSVDQLGRNCCIRAKDEVENKWKEGKLQFWSDSLHYDSQEKSIVDNNKRGASQDLQR